MITIFIIIFILYITISLIYELNSHRCDECKKLIWGLKPIKIYGNEENNEDESPTCIEEVYWCNQCKMYKEEE